MIISGQTIYHEVNTIRKTYHAQSLSPDRLLVEQANKRAKYLASTGIFSHAGLRSIPCKCRVLGENLAKGFTATGPVTKAWLTSNRHRENLLDKTFTRTGIGIATAPDGTILIVQLFAL